MSNPDSDAESAEGAIALPNVLYLDEPLDDNLRCTICLEVNREATTACNSGHTFCGPCLRQMSARGDEACPTCRATRINLPNRPVRDMVDNLRVRCNVGREDDGDSRKRSSADDSQSKSGGCDWEGSLGQWMEVHKKVCPYVTVKCPLGCTEEMRRMHLEHHVKEVCSAREVTCDKCQMELSHCLLQFHTDQMCPKGVVQCKYCGDEMTREALGKDSISHPQQSFPGIKDNAYWYETSGHYSKCPKYVLMCEFSRHGCGAKFAREDAAAHHAEQAQYHAALVNQKLNQTHERLNQTLERLDWDRVEFHWALSLSVQEVLGASHQVLESDAVSGMSQHEIFLKLHLGGPNEPIKISVGSGSMNCVPLYSSVVQIKNMHLKVTNNRVNPTSVYATFDFDEEKMITTARPNSGAFHWSMTPRKSDGSAFNRADLINSLEMRNGQPTCAIRAKFDIRKHSTALVRTRRHRQEHV